MGPVMRLPALGNTHSYSPQLAILAVLIVAAVIRVWGLGDASLWIDEGFTITTSSLPLSELWIGPGHPPPLFFSVEKFVLLFGDAEFLLRLPSAVFSVATVYIMYRAALLIAGFKAALPVAIILALSASNVEYAQEARTYSLLSMLMSLAFLGLVQLNKFIDKNDQKASMVSFLTNGGLLYGLATLGSLYTHFISVFFIFGVQVYFASLFVLKRKRFVELLKYWLIVNTIVFLCWALWLYASIDLSKTGAFSWLDQASIRDALGGIRFIHGLHFVSIGQPLVDGTIALAILAGLYFLREKPTTFILVFSLLVSSSLIIWLFGYIKPVFMTRTILWGSLFSALLLGIAFSKLETRLYVLALTATAVLTATDVSNYHDQDFAENENWKDAVNFIQSERGPSEPILLCADFTKDVFFYYSNKASLAKDHIYGWSSDHEVLWIGRFSTLENGRAKMDWKGGAMSLDALQAENQLWVVRSHCAGAEIAKLHARANELGLEKTQHRKFKRVEIWAFAKK